MRMWKPPQIPDSEELATNEQIVVKRGSRYSMLRTAYEIPLAGHLGINKICERIIKHFYWPSVKNDVVKFYKTCNV